MKTKTILLSIILFFSYSIFAQKKGNSWVKKHFKVNGYINYMNMLNIADKDFLMSDNILHNRLNLKAYLSKQITFTASMRNRIFYGDRVQLIPQYPDFIDVKQDIMDLSFFPFREKMIFGHSTFDRLNLNYSSGYWDITIGRQRINWGINTVWNPNDLFNSTNFLDFDYEEKPGADAVRVQYFTGDMSSLELVYHPNKDMEKEKSVLAALYRFNFKSFDLQLLAAQYYNDYSFGMGFAGNIKNAGLKGELSYFKTKIENEKDAFVASITIDYAFKNGLYWMASTLYNEGFQKNQNLDFISFFSTNLNARNLFPSTIALFTQFSGNFGPAWTWNTGFMYGVEKKLFIFMPSITYSISDNWETSLLSQYFASDDSNIGQSKILYLRFRYSF